MRIKRLNGMFTISTQVEPAKLEQVQLRGYRSVICNRPDGEGEDQPSFDEVARAAKARGLAVRYIPVKLAGATEAEHAAFAAAIEELPKPILAYCRSGTRCAMLWNHWDAAQSGGREGGAERRVAAMQVGALAPKAPAAAPVRRRQNAAAATSATGGGFELPFKQRSNSGGA